MENHGTSESVTGTGTAGESKYARAVMPESGNSPAPMNHDSASPEIKPKAAFPLWSSSCRGLLLGSGSSLLFSLSALCMMYGLARLATPLLLRDEALSDQLLCIGAVNIYEIALLAAMFLLVAWKRLPGDAVILGLLSPLFLTAGAVLLVLQATDHPRLTVILGMCFLVLGICKLLLLKRVLWMSLSNLMLTGVGLLLSWNFLISGWLAQRLQALDNAAAAVPGGMHLAWQHGWWLMLGGIFCLALASRGQASGSTLPQGSDSSAKPAFFHRPAMAWLFAGLLAAASLVHQRAVCYAFNFDFQTADFLPAAMLIAAALLPFLRKLPMFAREAAGITAFLPLAALIYFFANGPYPALTLFSAAVPWHPLVVLTVMAGFLVSDWRRGRDPELLLILGFYLLAGILLAGARPGSISSLNWKGAGVISVIAMLATGFLRRRPWTAAAGFAALSFGLLIWERNSGVLSARHFDALPAVMTFLGFSLIAMNFYFGSRYPRKLSAVGSVLIALCLLSISTGQQSQFLLLLLMISAAVLGFVVVWRFGNLPDGLLLEVPVLFRIAASCRNMTDWHWVGLGFLLLAAGTAFSLWKHLLGKTLHSMLRRYRLCHMSETEETGTLHKESFFAVVFTVFLILIMLAGVSSLPYSCAREKARRINCAMNLKQIGLALRMYAEDNDGWFPADDGDGSASLKLLCAGNYMSDSCLQCPTAEADGKYRKQAGQEPAAEVSYIYRGGFSEKSPPATVIAWDRYGNHFNFGSVLYADGIVKMFAGQDWPLKAGTEMP